MLDKDMHMQSKRTANFGLHLINNSIVLNIFYDQIWQQQIDSLFICKLW